MPDQSARIPPLRLDYPVRVDSPRDRAHGPGLFIRSLIGLDGQAATQAFDHYLSGTTYTATQIHFINLIITELTANGVMEPSRLYEAPFTEHAPQGPDMVFSDQDLDIIIDALNEVLAHAVPALKVVGRDQRLRLGTGRQS